MDTQRRPLVMESGGHELVGILDLPATGGNRGVIMVTGGPQYRVGSHRQFVLLARALAARGYPVFRFDYHGMGDSSGPFADFLECHDDIHTAIRAFREETGADQVVVLGLCDAASANLMYLATENGVDGLILINPWVRSDAGLARAQLRHYYVRRVLSTDFWRKVVSGEFRILRSLGDLAATVGKLVPRRGPSPDPSVTTPAGEQTRDFRELMLTGMSGFAGPVLLILCGDDLTADEFSDHVQRDRRWRKVLRRRNVTHRRLDGADHTFSRHEWRENVLDWILDWLRSW